MALYRLDPNEPDFIKKEYGDPVVFGSILICATEPLYNRDEMKKAFFAGWDKSAHGYNAESAENDPLVHDYLLAEFDKLFPEDDNA